MVLQITITSGGEKNLARIFKCFGSLILCQNGLDSSLLNIQHQKRVHLLLCIYTIYENVIFTIDTLLYALSKIIIIIRVICIKKFKEL